MRARTADARTCCAHVRACGCVFWRTRIRAEPCEPVPSARTACGFGAQAFHDASAFNANIGAWNIARVTSLNSVCAAFPARRRATREGRARRVFGAARAVVRGGTADACARVCAR
jgi:hypothetical protein